MPCDKIQEDLAAYSRGEIEGDRKDEIDRHIGECVDCQLELAGVRQVMDSMAATDEQLVAGECKRIITAAMEARASDVHLLPRDSDFTVRFRIDGALREWQRLSRPLGSAVATRIKAMAEMDVVETRTGQDGRILVRHDGTDIDIRACTMPTTYGQKVTMRLLRKGDAMLDLERLGMNESQLQATRQFLVSPSGLLIVTGPTGSGKTTLLYSMLSALDADALNIVTIEDPVEYMLPGIAQTHVNRKAGLTFHRGLLYQLRSDPDVVMCGEIRDLQSAEVVIQTAMTGHLVLSTLHAQTAPEVFRRFLNMGVEPFMVTDTLRFAVAMRLARTICDECKEPHEPTGPEREWLSAARVDWTGLSLQRGAGCDQCFDTGYRGRTGVFEVMTVTDPVREVVTQGLDNREFEHLLRSSGHKSLVDHGIEKIRAGITTVEEVAAISRAL